MQRGAANRAAGGFIRVMLPPTFPYLYPHASLFFSLPSLRVGMVKPVIVCTFFSVWQLNGTHRPGNGSLPAKWFTPGSSSTQGCNKPFDLHHTESQKILQLGETGGILRGMVFGREKVFSCFIVHKLHLFFFSFFCPVPCDLQAVPRLFRDSDTFSFLNLQLIICAVVWKWRNLFFHAADGCNKRGL